MKTCNFCKKELSNDPKSIHFDCGGDCLKCMATFIGDPDCIKKLANLGDQEGIELQKQLEYEAST